MLATKLNSNLNQFLNAKRLDSQPGQRVHPLPTGEARKRRHWRSLRRYSLYESGKQLRDNAEVAVKVIDLKNVNNEVTQYLLKMEKIAVMSCDSPHVLRGIKVIQNSSCCYIVTELCNGGSLKNQIKLRGPLSEEKSLQFLV